MVFNNAGVSASQSVAGGLAENDDWVFATNFGGVVNGVRAFLPILLRQNAGVIVNTSSIFGLVAFPDRSAYCASKFAIRGFTESLLMELRDTGVGVVTVYPGGVRTNLARNARYHPDPDRPFWSLDDAMLQQAGAPTTPERAAEIIHKGVAAGRSRIVVGPDAHVADALARLAPARYFDLMVVLLRIGDMRRSRGTRR
jgi:NAD(P)-dependent dehydrogenase (short-subunit alcohol dehydrogenase family)